MLIHIRHKEDYELLGNSFKCLCGTFIGEADPDDEFSIGPVDFLWDWTYKKRDGEWRGSVVPTCQACILLALIEPETVFVWGNDDNTYTAQR